MTSNQTCFPEVVQSSPTFFSACIFTPLILTIVLTIYFFVRRSKKMEWKENTVTVSASLLPIAILAIGSDKTELECLFFLQFITGFRNFDIVSCGVILTEILAGSLDLFIVLSVNTRIFMISNCNLRFDALQIVQLTKGTMIVSFALAVAQILCIVLAKKMVDIPNEFFKNFGPFPLSIVLYLPLLQVCVLLFILRKRNPKVDGKVDPINETKRMWKHGPKTTGNNSLFFTNCSPTPVSVF
ncbi:hypothetical protein GCK72_025783 [Caenorhabditis remanei]|uniref:Uncharacterized protein n=1 Tax=Caenorhabditis remanei TaxID=31234 RepID=A0A6A5G348_CAERE|nr:hypothetical protein GCK72_025783 [Caenorhabditis remanei]KAF1749316.1 hypothetical protein GCK72_025783 [Caenorhabditis remanei]